jgi:DnaJ-class molecular chaperone
VNGCQTCGGYGNRHDLIAHGSGPTWVTCPICNGDGCVRDDFDLDVTCQECLGDGGWEP